MRALLTLIVQCYYGHQSRKVRRVRSVTVSIGRNLGTVPMASDLWDTYCADTLRAVRQCSSAIHYLGLGEGIYDGMTEDSFTLVGSVYRDSIDRLAYALGVLAETYGQDSVAMSVGTTELVARISTT